MAYNLVHEHSTDLFKFDKRSNKFYATLAELGCNGIDSKCAEFFQPIERGFGFVLVSKKTGKKVPMRLVGSKKVKSLWDEDEVDVASWTFLPLRKNDNFQLEIVVGE